MDASSTYQWRDSFSIRAHKKSEFSFQLSTKIINVRSLIYVGYILIQHSSCCNSNNNKFMLASGDESRMIGNLTNTEDTIPYSECFHYPCLQLSTCHSLLAGFYCECQLGYTGKWALNRVCMQTLELSSYFLEIPNYSCLLLCNLIFFIQNAQLRWLYYLRESVLGLLSSQTDNVSPSNCQLICCDKLKLKRVALRQAKLCFSCYVLEGKDFTTNPEY